MIEIKPPNGYAQHAGKHSVFLAGSIEMGVAEDWQKALTKSLENHDVLILNPRRDNWDSSWEQKIENPQFRGQVEWELAGLDHASVLAFYFAPNTKSPITLMELGIHAATHPEKMVVCCPEGFWRKGNVDIVCARYGVKQVADLNELSAAVAEKIAAAPSPANTAKKPAP